MNKKAHIMAAVVAFAGMAATAHADKIMLTKVESQKVGNGLEIVLRGEGLSKPKELRILNDTSFIAEFACDWIVKPGKVNINHAGVKSVSWGWWSAKPALIRVHLKVDPSVKPVIIQRNGDWVIQVGVNTPKPHEATTKTGAPELPFLEDAAPRMGFGTKRDGDTKTAVDKISEAKTPQQASPTLEYPRDTSKWPDGRPKLPNSAGGNSLGNVSLDFVQTDVVQILKALAIQAGVNVIISPEVSGQSSTGGEPAKSTKLTISLTNVTVEQALDYVCALSRLRYMRTGNAFLVTTAERFAETARQLADMSKDNNEIRIVPIISGQGLQLREAVYRWFGRQTVEVMLPSEMRQTTTTSTTTDPKAGTTTATQATMDVQDGHLFLIGDKKWLDGAEALIRRLDRELITIKQQGAMQTNEYMNLLGDPMVQEVYNVRFVQNEVDLRSIAASTPNGQNYAAPKSGAEKLAERVKEAFKDVTFVPAPIESANQVIILKGSRSQVRQALDLLQSLDSPQVTEIGGVRVVDEIIQISHIDPEALIKTIQTRFPGLQASLVPDYALPVVDKTREVTTKVGNIDTKHDKRDAFSRLAIAVRGLPADIQLAKDFIRQVDVAPKQVALELRVMEMTKEEAVRFGIDWNLLTGGRLTQFRLNQGLGDNPATPGTISGSYNFRGADTLSALATLDKMNNGRNVIARPNALVTDGRTTTLFVGDIVRYIKTIQSSQNGTTVQTDEIPVGVLFNFTARVGAKNELVFHVDQNFSILNGFTPVPGGGNLPQTSERKTDMMVNMQSGETIAIGGLILEQDRKRISGIPILMDLPIIGRFFSRTDNSKIRTEIVFFLTAVVVDEATRPDAASPRTSMQRNPDPMKDYLKTGKGNGNGKAPALMN